MQVDHHEEDALRSEQEREIALEHSLTSAEHAIAQEAISLARTFERAGIDFDPLTFVALRIVEGSEEEQVDPVECLEVLCRFGFVERAVTLTNDLLDAA